MTALAALVLGAAIGYLAGSWASRPPRPTVDQLLDEALGGGALRLSVDGLCMPCWVGRHDDCAGEPCWCIHAPREATR